MYHETQPHPQSQYLRFQIPGLRRLLRPAGLLLILATSSAFATVRYVDVNNANPAPPYTGWATAAADIQSAVDAAVGGDEIIVTNGVYSGGGRAIGPITNRVAVDKALTVRSVNGPKVTLIQGTGDIFLSSTHVRGAYLADGATLSGFTVSDGWAFDGIFPSGGGVWCETTNAVITNCVLAGNVAIYAGGGAYGGTLNNCVVVSNSSVANGRGFGGAGGGAFGSRLNNCLVYGNSGGTNGGGASYCILNNCTLSANDALSAGGASFSTLNNCILAPHNSPYNSVPWFGNTMNYSCTPSCLPQARVTSLPRRRCDLPRNGNSCGPPIELPLPQRGQQRLRPRRATDLDGRPRVAGGTVDMGAYEYQPGASGAFIAWLAQYGLPTDGWLDYTDPDADGRNNWQEWRCQTNPTMHRASDDLGVAHRRQRSRNLAKRRGRKLFPRTQHESDGGPAFCSGGGEYRGPRCWGQRAIRIRASLERTRSFTAWLWGIERVEIECLMSINLICNLIFEISDFRFSFLRLAALLLVLPTTSAFAYVR